MSYYLVVVFTGDSFNIIYLLYETLHIYYYPDALLEFLFKKKVRKFNLLFKKVVIYVQKFLHE